MSARLMITVAGKTLPLTFDAGTHAGPLLSSATTAWAGLPFELHRIGSAENVGEVGPPDGEYGLFVMMEGSAEFVVREPYEINGTRYSLKKGLIAPGQRLKIKSHMRAGRLYLDGPHTVHVVEMASVLEFRQSNEPLQLLGFTRKRNGKAHEAR